MNAISKASRHLVIDLRAESGQAAERRLDVSTRAAEPVVEIEMAKGGVEIVEPHQADDAAAEPDAFGISGRAVDGLRSLQELVGLALIVLGDIGGIGRGRLAGLVLGAVIAALGEGASAPDQEGEPGNGEMAQNRMMKLKHTSTHKFPDYVARPRASPDALVVMPSK
jgi:hypothetical protein